MVLCTVILKEAYTKANVAAFSEINRVSLGEKQTFITTCKGAMICRNQRREFTLPRKLGTFALMTARPGTYTLPTTTNEEVDNYKHEKIQQVLQ